MTALVVPDLDPNWPTVDIDTEIEEAHLLHALVIESGIPAIVLDRPRLLGTDEPGAITFDWDDSGTFDELYERLCNPPLQGDYPGPMPRTRTGALRCAWFPPVGKAGRLAAQCSRPGLPYCDKHTPNEHEDDMLTRALATYDARTGANQEETP